MNQMGTRRKYSDEFETEPGTSIQRIAVDLGINAGMLRSWIKKASGQPGDRKNAPDLELNNLRSAGVKMPVTVSYL